MLKPVCFLDTETTGLDPRKHEIIEIATYSDRDGEWSSKIKPLRIEDAESQALTINGYNPEDWVNAPTFKEVWPEVQKRMSGHILCGHNLPGFDYQFLKYEAERIGEKIRQYHCLDTITLAMEHLPSLYSFSLNPVCRTLGISNEGEHGAMIDVLRARAVYNCLLKATENDRDRWSRKVAELNLHLPKEQWR